MTIAQVISLTYRITKSHYWAKVIAKNQFKTATGTRQVPISEPNAFTKAIQWAQENAINQLKETHYV